MTKKLTGMVAFVTGSGGSGIGTAIALRLAKEGASIVANDLMEELAKPTVRQIEALGGVAFTAIGDVSNTDHVNEMVANAVNRFGRIDILVNVVGIGGRSAIIEMPDEEWMNTLKVDLTAPFKMCRAVVPVMRRQQFGRIINIGSIGGLRVNFVTGAHVTAAKSGLLGLTRHLAAEELENNITVNTVLPGGTLTPKLTQFYSAKKLAEVEKSGRMATAEDIADAVAFLATKESRKITGSYIPVDGGSLIFPGSLEEYLRGRDELFSNIK